MNQIPNHPEKQPSGGVLSRPAARRVLSPAVDVFENADEVLIVADVPGVPASAIEVRVENDTLTLEAKRPNPAEGGPPALAREYGEVDFERHFRIPAGIDAGKVSAETKRGTVIVKLPKAAAAKPRKIAVQSS